MNISKADALAFLAKWFKAQTEVRAFYTAVTGNVVVQGKIAQLTSSAIKIVGNGSDMLLFFRDTSEYDYKDTHEPSNQAGTESLNKYPAFIEVKFQNGDRLEISESFQT